MASDERIARALEKIAGQLSLIHGELRQINKQEEPKTPLGAYGTVVKEGQGELYEPRQLISGPFILVTRIHNLNVFENEQYGFRGELIDPTGKSVDIAGTYSVVV